MANTDFSFDNPYQDRLASEARSSLFCGIVRPMKTVVVTGGTGYVGSRSAEALAKKGYRVIVVDIVPPEDRGIRFSQGIEFRHYDLRIPQEAEKGLKDAGVVLHLAADIGSLTYMHEHQAEIMTNNTLIDSAVYPAMLKNKIPWIVYSSSSGIYQYAPKYPYVEKDALDIKPPTNTYFFSKLAGEYFCRSYAEQYDLAYTIIRYHNIYGPGEDSKGSSPGDVHVIPALLEKVLIKKQYPLEILGNPEATRPFTYVDDAVSATIGIVERAAKGEKVVTNEDFNIGTDTYHSVLKLARIIWERYGDGREFKYTVVETNADTALRREVDITKIREKLGWEPKVSLEQGLEPTAGWIRTRG